ncbi:MAG: hypothetical protein NC231_14770 [Bacillus sp. (in: Bacteria)]|nr:hypothetical protein [Bacillus sp. (in: firmicutes)]MCM1427506.1 hypothetical protein [Eubacterium sp.]
MAVGKGSMARAAKAAGQGSKATAKAAEKAVMQDVKPSAAEKKAAAPAKKASAKPVAAAETIAAPSKEVLEQIVYQTSSGMLERDAMPNEIFGLGDAMPVYYF